MVLVDTNVVSEARRGAREAVSWLNAVDPSSVFISVVTIGEIQRGIVNKQKRDGRPPSRLIDWLEALQSSYGDRILPIDAPTAVEWGRMSAVMRRPDADGLIAATALLHGLALATRNVADFKDTGLTLINPWSLP